MTGRHPLIGCMERDTLSVFSRLSIISSTHDLANGPPSAAVLSTRLPAGAKKNVPKPTRHALHARGVASGRRCPRFIHCPRSFRGLPSVRPSLVRSLSSNRRAYAITRTARGALDNSARLVRRGIRPPGSKPAEGARNGPLCAVAEAWPPFMCQTRLLMVHCTVRGHVDFVAGLKRQPASAPPRAEEYLSTPPPPRTANLEAFSRLARVRFSASLGELL